LRALPERQQEAVRLKFQQNLTYRQIAEVLDITESNVGFILHTALTTLRNDMNLLQGDPS
jgi:RNA polymerase sigma-70 factor (ECF subfamily)